MTGSSTTSDGFTDLAAALARCRLCRDAPTAGGALPHEPRPIVQGTARARILLASQAPGARAHRSGIPFQDPSGIRLRAWLGLDEPRFYDPDLLAIVPMGACFPGHDAAGGDLPPRRECAPRWRAPLLAALPSLELVLLIGQHAQRFHLGRTGGLGETVARWREIAARPGTPRLLPLPHPSWRNTAWLKRHPWFEAEVLPWLRAEVARIAG